jgi:hypothetical protein
MNSKDRAIGRLERDIEPIEDALMPTEDEDDQTRVVLLRRNREQLVRGLILDVHLAIDDLSSCALRNTILEGRSTPTVMRTEVDGLLEGNRALRFYQKLVLARSLGWLTPKQFRELEGLNTVRNRCGHGWQLSQLVRRGVKRKAPKKPVLRYLGKNVYQTDVLIDFVRHFWKLYLRLYAKLEV